MVEHFWNWFLLGLSLLLKLIEDVFLDLYFKDPMLKIDYIIGGFQVSQIIHCAVGIPKFTRFLFRCERFWQRFNNFRFIFLFHSLFVQQAPYHEPKSARPRRSPYECRIPQDSAPQ